MLLVLLITAQAEVIRNRIVAPTNKGITTQNAGNPHKYS